MFVFAKNRSSQIKALLSFLYNRLLDESLDIQNIWIELFYYLIKLVFEDESLVCHIYRILDLLLGKTTEKEQLVESLMNKRDKIDMEYPDTLLQIWHYYVLFKHCGRSDKNSLIDSLKNKKYNPLVVATMVEKETKKNKKVYYYIRDSYREESISANWKAEIMYSKWWLPLFRILQYDDYNYEKFMNSANVPETFKRYVVNDISDEGETD